MLEKTASLLLVLQHSHSVALGAHNYRKIADGICVAVRTVNKV
jgi:hypothetical protein